MKKGVSTGNLNKRVNTYGLLAWDFRTISDKPSFLIDLEGEFMAVGTAVF